MRRWSSQHFLLFRSVRFVAAGVICGICFMKRWLTTAFSTDCLTRWIVTGSSSAKCLCPNYHIAIDETFAVLRVETRLGLFLLSFSSSFFFFFLPSLYLSLLFYFLFYFLLHCFKRSSLTMSLFQRTFSGEVSWHNEHIPENPHGDLETAGRRCSFPPGEELAACLQTQTRHGTDFKVPWAWEGGTVCRMLTPRWPQTLVRETLLESGVWAFPGFIFLERTTWMI